MRAETSRDVRGGVALGGGLGKPAGGQVDTVRTMDNAAWAGMPSSAGRYAARKCYRLAEARGGRLGPRRA